MTPQMVTVEVDQNTALALQRLKEKAARQGVTVDSLIYLLFENSSGLKEERPFYETASPQELAQVAQDFIAAAQQRPEIGRISTTFSASTMRHS